MENCNYFLFLMHLLSTLGSPFLSDFSLFFFFKDFIYLFIYLFIYFQRVGKGGRKRGRETSMCGCLSHGAPATQAYALTGNPTSDPLVLQPVLSPLSHTSQGPIRLLILVCISWMLYIFLFVPSIS